MQVSTKNAPSDGEHWYVAQLKANSGAIARRNLERQGFDVFLPLIAMTKQRSRRFVTVKAPLFPGYIFVHDVSKSARLAAVNSTQGISRLVSFGNAPVTVPSHMLASLFARCDENGVLIEGSRFSVGETVSLTTGPFAEFVGRIESIDADQRIWLLLEFMGRQTRVCANADTLMR
ncbi:transcription termination/antitermination protein NusG [Thioclava indica]|uniref:Transcription termination/antitermination protein NusG n=1 Tax=Thioclava indica TaxID=1353528 RepID=A0A074JRH6_9RHOB|nr:transcriptional activator RfaH [Thioclava indica]KEO58238.1 hypothetical protein DT23_16690 [Thioclava indica]